jgi:hypothetical protein
MRLGLFLGLGWRAPTGSAPASAPTLTSVSPNSAHKSDSPFTLTATGTNFTISSVLRLDGSGVATTYVSPTSLTCTVTPASLAAATHTVDVTDTTGPSGTQSLAIDHAAPTLSGISPSSATVGASNTTITCTGTGFDSATVIYAGALALATTYVSATQVTAVFPSTALTAAGTSTITAFNTTPGGGTSAGQTFTINNPVPAPTSLATASYPRWDGAKTGTINGSGFVSGSVVKVDGVAVTTAYVSSSQLQFSVANTTLWELGTHAVTVTNASPGGGTSGAQTLTIAAPTFQLAGYRGDQGRTMNGGTVQAWADQSGKGDANRNAIQLTAGSQPTYLATDTNLNNQPSLTSSGSAGMQTGTWSSAPAQPTRFYLVGYTSTTSGFFFDGITTGNRQCVFKGSSSNTSVFAGSTVNTALWDSTTKAAFCVEFNGASSKVAVSTKTFTTIATPGTGTVTGLSLFENFGTGGKMIGAIAELIVTDGTPTATQHSEIMLYLGNRYNITIGP